MKGKDPNKPAANAPNDALDNDVLDAEAYTAEEDERYSDEMELVGEADEADEADPNYDAEVPGDDYPTDGYPDRYDPQDFPKADLEDVSTAYTEGGLEDENRSSDNIVSDLDLGEAVYYERDNDYEHMDGPLEDDEELDDEDGYELDEAELEERMIREQVEEDEEEKEA